MRWDDKVFQVPPGYLAEAKNLETGQVALCERGTWALENQEVIFKWYEQGADANWQPCEDPRLWAAQGGRDAIDILAMVHDAPD